MMRFTSCVRKRLLPLLSEVALAFASAIDVAALVLGDDSLLFSLQTRFCRGCFNEPELLGFNGTVCLLGCDKPGCEKRLFRIETA